MALTPEQMAEITAIKDRLCVSKVVATRTVKTKNGDFFVGFSAAWDTVQEDAGGPGTDLIDGMAEGEQRTAIVQRGMTLKEARIATLILGMNVDIQAVTHALCGGALTEAEHAGAVRAIRRNYTLKLGEVTAKNGVKNGDVPLAKNDEGDE